MSARSPHRIDVSIDRLLLRGFSADQRALIVGQLHGELSRLLADPQIAAEIARGRHLANLRIAPSSPTAMAPDPVGVQAAGAIVRGLRE